MNVHQTSGPVGPTAFTPATSDFDIFAVAGYLDGRLAGFRADEPFHLDLLAGGRSNLTYRLRQDRHDWALRRPPLGHIMESAHDMKREFTVQAGLNRVGFPAPTMQMLCTESSVMGADFYVMDFVAGDVFASAEDTSDLTSQACERLSAAQVSTLAALHAVDLTAAQLDDLGRSTGYVSRQIRRWTKQWEATKTRDLTSASALADWLAANAQRIPQNESGTLVHGDYRLDNLVINPDTFDVRAVLDWEMATVGDPLADLAVALVYWSEPGDTLRAQVPVSELVTTTCGFYTRAQFAQHYSSITGRDLANLDIYVALACFKLGVIMESIHFRTLAGMQRGVSASDGSGHMGRACEALIELGLLTTRRGWNDALAA